MEEKYMGMQKCHLSSIPGLNLWDLHGGRKSNPIDCPLTFPSRVILMCTHYPSPHFKRWLHNTNLPWNWCQGHEVAMSTGTMYPQPDILKNVPPFPLLHIFLYSNWLVVPSHLKGNIWISSILLHLTDQNQSCWKATIRTSVGSSWSQSFAM